MSQHFRFFQRTQVWVSAATWWLIINSKRSDSSSDLCGHLITCGEPTQTQTNTHSCTHTHNKANRCFEREGICKSGKGTLTNEFNVIGGFHKTGNQGEVKP